jgi:hypothetical protein
VGVRTVTTIHCNHDPVNRFDKLGRQLAGLTRPGKKFWSDLAGNRSIFVHQIQRELALPTTKDQLRLNARPRAFLLGT